MTRARCRMTLATQDGKSLAGASVYVYQPNGTTPIAETMYDDITGGNVLTNPLTADANSSILFYLDAPKRVDLMVRKTGYADLTIPDVPVMLDAEDTTSKGHDHTSGNGALIPAAALAADVLSGVISSMVSKAFADSPYTVPAWGYHIDVDASGGAVTVNIPTAVGNVGALIEVRKTDASANTVTVDGNGAETINGAATLVIYSQYDSYSLRSDGASVEVV